MYLKKGLRYAIYYRDAQSELNFYDKLSVAHMNIGDSEKMNKYHDRVMHELVEPVGGKDFVQIMNYFKTKKRQIKGTS